MKPPTLDTPLRRSEAVAPRSSFSSPVVVSKTRQSILRHTDSNGINVEETSQFQNDDEAERRASRARAALNETPNTISDNESLTNCLRVFHENVNFLPFSPTTIFLFFMVLRRKSTKTMFGVCR